ncbi:condensation domain-containing protein, partial [Nonomuraea lactucae]|uniref:condensation domain-containing protein n=1 Tax=Nonomuraea lactucae TaxID=2249762 RepID=UPI001F054D2A
MVVKRTGDRTPMSIAQRALWLVEQTMPGTAAYNVPVGVRLDGDLDVLRLKRAIGRVVARHEILRTTFPQAPAQEPDQRIGPRAEPDLPLTDLSHESPGRGEALAARLLQRWADEPFDLVAGPLIRTRLIRLAAGRHVLGIVMHQLVCDGPSIHLLFDELAGAYAEEADLPPLPVQFADYAAWQRGRPADTDGLAWWGEQLDGAPTLLPLPTDRPHPPSRGPAGATCTHLLPGPLMTEAFALARRLRVTPFALTLAAYAALLGRLTGSRDLLIGTPVNGRLSAELDPLIGFFVNTLPVRADLSGDPAFGELARRVHRRVLDLLGHQEVPFEKLVELLAPDRGPSHTPLVQTYFTFESTPLADPRLPGLAATLVDVMPSAAKVDLDLMIVRTAAGRDDFQLSITYSTDLFHATTISALADRFHRVLAAGVADPGVPLRSLPVLADAERRTILGQWNAAPPVAGAALVHEGFASRAADAPDALAVRADGVTRTFGEVRER